MSWRQMPLKMPVLPFYLAVYTLKYTGIYIFISNMEVVQELKSTIITA